MTISTLQNPKITFKLLCDILALNIKNFDYDLNLEIIYTSNDVEVLTAQNRPFIYFARYGKSFDGHKLCKKVLESGNFFIGEKSRLEDANVIDDKKCILVENVFDCLCDVLNKLFKISQDDFNFIAVTGTNGKTSVTQFTGQILEEISKTTVAKIGTLGVQIGDQKIPGTHVTTPEFPMFIRVLDFLKKQNIKHCVLEATSHGLYEKRLGDFKFDTCIFTNFTQDHLDFHGNLENYLNAKKVLFLNHLKENGSCIVSTSSKEWTHFFEAARNKNINAFICLNDYSEQLSHDFQDLIKKEIKNFKNIFLFWVEDKKNTLQGISGRGILFDINTNQRNEFTVNADLVGDFNFENLSVSICSCLAAGNNLSDIIEAIKKLKGIPGRLQLVRSSKPGPVMVVDYAHSPDALEKSILSCRKILPQNGKIVTIFGCGGERDHSKRPMMGRVAKLLSDKVIITNDNPRSEDPSLIIKDILSGLDDGEKHDIVVEQDRKKALVLGFNLSGPNDIVLIAGKGHETTQIIGKEKIYFSDFDEAQKILA